MSAGKRSKNTSSVKRLRPLAKLIVALGLVLMTTAVQWQNHEKAKLSFAASEIQESPIESLRPQPTFVTIPSVSLSLPVYQTNIQGRIWEISRDGASHLTNSAHPGDTGTIILYSHNTNDRFGPIRWTKKDDMIRLVTEDGIVHEYIVRETMIVDPTDVDVLSSPLEETLILYTCDGFADSKRFVLKAEPRGKS